MIRQQVNARRTKVQQCIIDHFTAHGLITDHPAIDGDGTNAAGAVDS
jgi:hypothetical protein